MLTAVPTVAEMGALTSAHILYLHPHNLHRSDDVTETLSNPIRSGWSATNVDAPSELHMGEIRLDLYTTNNHWTRPCGRACLAIRRHLNDFAGIRSFNWRTAADDVFDSMQYSSLTWRIGLQCYNSFCDMGTSTLGTND